MQLGVVRSIVERRSSVWLRAGAVPIEAGSRIWKNYGPKRFTGDSLPSFYCAAITRWAAISFEGLAVMGGPETIATPAPSLACAPGARISVSRLTCPAWTEA